MHDVMMDFAAQNSIKPTIEKFEINKAGMEFDIEWHQSGKMIYRFFLVHA